MKHHEFFKEHKRKEHKKENEFSKMAHQGIEAGVSLAVLGVGLNVLKGATK